MEKDYILLFTHHGMGDAPEDLRLKLVVKFLSLTLESENLPAKILFYTEGVRLACEGSPVLDLLRKYELAGVELVLCQTCLDYFGIEDKVKIGVVGGMGDILEALQKAPKVLSM